jgi:hypothetical protein
MNQKQYGGSLGGPIVKDRTFFFGNAEQRRLDQTGLVTIAPDSVDAINARLSRAGYPGANVSTGLYPNPVRSTHALGKIDHQFNGRDQVGISYSLPATWRQTTPRGAGGLNAPSASAISTAFDQTIAFSKHELSRRRP